MEKWIKLGASLLIDLFGMGSVVFGVTEVTDTLYAPLSAVAIYLLYGDSLWASIGFTEEIMPMTDFVPTATIAWAYSYYM